MLVWLGKQYLGQTDKRDLRHGAEKDLPAVFTLNIGDKEPPLLPPEGGE